ncbi:MAG: DUF1499 domain-containing protein [Deltaproteobacteria bacterium]|nr:DUF1499 domain-containing protein [Deltaproteobacteria bacterium]MBI3390951.1 DUF1499 domain-containing protein [Deltaproteobacteria bacterium]
MASSSANGSSWAMRLGLAAVVAFVIGPALAHLGIVPSLIGFAIFGVGGLLGLIATVVGVIGALRSRSSWLAIVPGAVIVVSFIAIASRGAGYPRINDITTDFEPPPVFRQAFQLPANRGRDMRYPGATFWQQQRAGYPNLTNLILTTSPDETYQRVLAMARTVPNWELTLTEPETRAIEGVETSWLFRFQDDFAIEVRPHSNGSQVAMRSKSRDGKGDLGVNAKRIETFFAKLK